MDFRHISAFIAVADASSVTKAAERLHISQPPLTRQIHQLEQELGLTLFVRHRHGVVLTDGGRRLLEKARQWDLAAAEFAEAAGQLKAAESGRLRVGIGWGLWDLVNLARVEFAKDHPETTIEALDAYCHFDSDALLRNHAIDVAFARPPYDPEFQVSDVVAEERIQAILPADHPLAERSSVSMADLAATTLLLWDRHNAPVLYDQIFALYQARRRDAAYDGDTRRRAVQPRRHPAGRLGQGLLSRLRRADQLTPSDQRRHGRAGVRSRRDGRGADGHAEERGTAAREQLRRMRVSRARAGAGTCAPASLTAGPA